MKINAIPKTQPDTDKLVDALLELIKQLSREQGLDDNWRSKSKK